MALAILGTGLAQLHVHLPPGTWQGAAGALAYALAKFLLDCRDEFPSGRGWLYLAQVIAPSDTRCDRGCGNAVIS